MQTQQPLMNVQPAIIPADPGKRILALVIDCAPVLLVIIPILGPLLWLGWLLCRDLAFGGQSLGKKAMGLKVINVQTGQTPDAGKLILRNAVFFIPCFGLVELIVYFTNAEKRRLGDQWSGCAVVAQ